MELSKDEIVALEKLSLFSQQNWFSIRTPNYVWDADNKIRMNLAKGCKEFIECSRDFVKNLSNKQRGIINELEKKIDSYIADCDS